MIVISISDIYPGFYILVVAPNFVGNFGMPGCVFRILEVPTAAFFEAIHNKKLRLQE